MSTKPFCQLKKNEIPQVISILTMEVSSLGREHSTPVSHVKAELAKPAHTAHSEDKPGWKSPQRGTRGAGAG